MNKRKEETQTVQTGENGRVSITHADRVVFPGTGQTKGDLANYYMRIAPLMLEHLARRPVSLVRCPQGRAGKCFFQKHDTGGLGAHVHQVSIREKAGELKPYLYLDSGAGLLDCVQMGTIEFHAWACHEDTIEQPDRMIFDLDPDEGLDFEEVRHAAADVRARLAEKGLASFPMLTGGKGIHVIVPLQRGHGWDEHGAFARDLAESLSQAEPERFVAVMAKAKRKGKIFIDWLRNQRGATAVVPYSARARPGAPVAVPVTWEELPGLSAASAFSIGDADALIERAADGGLQGWGIAEQPLPGV
ncbi:non-homologous end-joining DNA ligase [Novosphingobium beihaiensis]|uniref:non-homologous end-joining DNA ligase n=1 Tax=Novosphingobium beihaiensis TaxID=2930389 RepID=UPI0038995069